jgi:hypothetical protein
MAAGWLARREVEIMEGRSHGWIDVLGCYPQTGAVLVVEVKTEIDDVGQIERAMAWYEREAPSAARRFGWNPHKIVALLIVLDTRATARRLRANRDAIAQTFPLRAEWLMRCLRGETAVTKGPARALAAIDPASRRTTWLRPTVLDGRRSPAAYEDYAEFSRWLTLRERI